MPTATKTLPELAKTAKRSKRAASKGSLTVFRIASGAVSASKFYDEAARVSATMNSLLSYIRVARNFLMMGMKTFEEGGAAVSDGKIGREVARSVFKPDLDRWTDRKLAVKPSTAVVAPQRNDNNKKPLAEDIRECEDLLYSCISDARHVLKMHRRLTSSARDKSRIKRARKVLAELLEETFDDQAVTLRARVRSSAFRAKKKSKGKK